MGMFKTRRYGRVELSFDVLKAMSDEELYELYALLGAVLRVEDHFYNMRTVLLVANPNFRELTEGEVIPRYAVEVYKTPLGKMGVRFLLSGSDSLEEEYII